MELRARGAGEHTQTNEDPTRQECVVLGNKEAGTE